MDPGINHMNARSWETLVLSILKVGLLRITGMVPKTEINLIGTATHKRSEERRV